MAGAPADTVGAAPGAIVGKVSAGFLQQAISSAILRCAARAAGDGSGGDGGDEQDAAGLGAPAALPSPAKSANESIELAYEDDFDEDDVGTPLPPARSTESTGAEGEQGAGATADEVVRVEDDGAFVWKVASSAVRRTWPSSAEGGPIELRHGSGNAVTACVVVFGGRAVLTATHGGEMTLWALPSGVELCTVHAHLRRVSHCAVWESAASGGKKPRHRVLSSSQDGTAVVWDLSLSQSELARAISEQRGAGGAALAPRYSLEDDDDDDDASSATATAVGPVDSAETEELRRAAAEAAAAKVRTRAGEGGGLSEWEAKQAEAVARQEAPRGPRKLASLNGSDRGQPTGVAAAQNDDGAAAAAERTRALLTRRSYSVVIERHPAHGLGITVDTDGDNNAFIDALVAHPDGAPGAAEAVGVEVGSVVQKIGDVAVLGRGVQAVGAAVKHTLEAGKPLAFTLFAPKAAASTPKMDEADEDGVAGEEEGVPSADDAPTAAAGGADEEGEEDFAVDTRPEEEDGEADGEDGGDGTGDDDGDGGDEDQDLFADLLVVGTSIDPALIDAQFEGSRRHFEPAVLRGRGIKLLARLGHTDSVDDEDTRQPDKPKPSRPDASDAVVACQWSPQGKLACLLLEGGELHRWSFHKSVKDLGKQRVIPQGSGQQPTCMCWASGSEKDGRVLVGTSEGRLTLVALESMADLATLPGHSAPVSGCVWQGGGGGGQQADSGSSSEAMSTAVSCSWDATLRLWSIQEEYSNFIVTAVASIAAPHALKIMRSLSLSPAGDEVVVAADGSVAIVNIGAQTIRTTVEHAPHSGNVTVVAYGGTAAADGDDAEVVDGAGAGSVADVDAAPAPFFVSGGENGVARVWPQSYAPEQCYVAQLVGQQTTASDDDDDDDDVDDVDDNGGDGRRHGLHCCAASEAGRCMAFGGVDGAVRLWSTAAAGAPPPPPVHCQRIEPHDGAGDAWCCGFSGDGSLIAVGYDDGTARVYDVVSGKVRASLEDFGMESVQCCCFNDDASLLATGGWEGELRVWETGSWECAGTLQGHSAQVRGCDFLGGKSQASAVVASASADCTVRVWRCADEAEIAELRAHTGPVNEVRLFSGGGGGTRAVSASDDMSLILWDVATGSALQTLSGHRAPVASCALHHHGGGGGGGRLLLLSVSWDATVRCWDLDDGAVQAEAIVLPPKAKWGACAVLAPPPAVASAAAADAANADTSIAAVDADADAAPTEAEVPGAGALAPVSVIVCGSTGAAEVRFSQLAGTGFM